MSRDRGSERDSHRHRDRSRSRDRDRDRTHDERRRYRDEHDDRDRRGRWNDSEDDDDYRRRRSDRDYRRRDHFLPVVFLEKVPESITQSEITRELSRYMERIRDIRVFKRASKKDEPYKSAVVEFYEKADARRWLNVNKDCFCLLGEQVVVEGSIDREESPEPVGDWICFQCHKLNFSRRNHCISCNYSRRDSERDCAREGPPNERAPPANVLIVRGLDPQTSEIDVVGAVSTRVPGLRMKDVRMMRDKGSNLSRGFCFLEVNTLEEAKTLLERLTSKDDPFLVSGKRVMVDYARPSNTWNSSKNPTNSMASAAIAQAQWSHVSTGGSTQDPAQSSSYQASHQGADTTAATKNTASGELPSSYSYDESSGFYYDSNTGLYYDPKTQYHYNSQTGQYCYYDPNQLKYIPVDSEGNPVSETATPATQSAGKKKKDVNNSLVSSGSMSAKKIAKNMERWAKSVNAAKSAQKQMINVLTQQAKQETAPPVNKPSGFGRIPNVGIAVGTTVPQATVDKPSKTVSIESVAPPPKHTLPPGADTNPTHTDWDQLACLLCQRKFPSKEVLVKHQQFSELHKQNLLKWKNPQQTDGATTDQPKYRDRAQERRNLVGTQPIIPEWKKRVDQEVAQGPSIPYEQPTVHGLKEDNIGNKMLTAMGWSDGQGLGKSNQGIVEPIKAEIRQSSAGLGARGSTYGYGVGDDYRSNVRAMTQARYKETM